MDLGEAYVEFQVWSVEGFGKPEEPRVRLLGTYTLSTKPVSPKPLSPKSPKTLSPRPLSPKPLHPKLPKTLQS